jgi:hypothetical protein
MAGRTHARVFIGFSVVRSAAEAGKTPVRRRQASLGIRKGLQVGCHGIDLVAAHPVCDLLHGRSRAAFGALEDVELLDQEVLVLVRQARETDICLPRPSRAVPSQPVDLLVGQAPRQALHVLVAGRIGTAVAAAFTAAMLRLSWRSAADGT